MNRSRLWVIGVSLLLLIPAALYILGLAAGNPRPDYSPSTEQNAWLNPETVYHPDEFAYVGLTYRMLLNHEWNPHYFHNPSLNIYSNMIMFWAAGAQNWPHDLAYGDREIAPFALHVTARYLSALYSLLTVALTYQTGRIAFGRRAGLIAAAAVAIAPLMVQHAHYATPNAETTLFSTAALLMGVIVLYGRIPARWPLWSVYGFAGLMVGLTMAARYNAVVIGLITGLAMVTAWWQHRRWLPVIVGAIMMPLGFALGTPGIVLAPREVINQIRDILEWYRELGGGSGFSAGRGLPSIYIHWCYVVLMSVGPGVTIAALIGLGLTLRGWRSVDRPLCWRKGWLGGMLAVYMLVYTVLALPGIRLQANLLFPLVVPLALLAGYTVARLWKLRRVSQSRYARAWIAASLIVLLAWPLLVSVLFVYRVDTLDNRLKAQAWIYANIPRGTRIHLLGAYNVPIDPLDYQVQQTYKHGVLPRQLAETDIPIMVYSDAGPFVTLRDPSLSPDQFVAVEEGVRDLLENEWIELARFDRMWWPGENLPPDDVSYWHQMAIVIYCNPANCPVERE
ncbi:MAG: glycosyltransferase family 39 protein [Anaerolineae bacterium]|nr:glycosyltransferase family 39 protein [Anaerolineae bacterium]